MNNFFNNIFNKIRIGNSSAEKKTKEEEDVVGEFNLQFRIEHLTTNEILDRIIKGQKVNGLVVEKYNNIKIAIMTITRHYKS
jgi:hypothetical protein